MDLRPDELHRAIRDQRRDLADLLESLDEEQWSTPSLCDGWTVKDVAAHVTFAMRVRPLPALLGLLRAGGNFNRFTDADVRGRRHLRPAELISELRELADVRRHPPATKPVDPLVDVLVHGQDIAVPLGIDRPMPSAAAQAAADRVWSMGFPFSARKRLAGVTLRADNADWTAGEGPVAEGPIESVLLLLAGRRAGLGGLRGEGAEALRAAGE